VSKRTTH